MDDVVKFPCPKCATRVAVAAVQGERCPTCGLEFTRFGANERQAALDFHETVTGEKYLVELSEQGWVSAHG